MLTKPDFIALMAERCKVSKRDATEMYEDVFGVLTEVLSEGNEVAIPNLGRFKITDRAARVARNPSTGENIEVPAKKAIKLQLSKNIKDAVAQL